MGGVLLALQAVIANKRAVAMENAANAQVDVANAQGEVAQAQAKAIKQQAKANRITEEGQRQERMKNAIEHLGHQEVSVRLGGAYELFHLAQDTAHLRQTVLDILCAHIRQTTSGSKYRDVYKSKPSEEIQSLLNLLFVQNHKVFKKPHINLQGSWLNGVQLSDARLEGAILSRASLEGAHLSWARLQRATLIGGNFQKANLEETQLQGADLNKAQLQGAWLECACMQGAYLRGTQLHGADISDAELQGAFIYEAVLQGVDLTGAEMQGAFIRNSDFQEATFDNVSLEGVTSQTNTISFETQIIDRIGEESDLLGMNFTGGLKQESIDDLVNVLEDDYGKELGASLTRHVNQPVSHELPEDSSAKVGSYTREQAVVWIKKYEEAISGVPDNEKGTA